MARAEDAEALLGKWLGAETTVQALYSVERSLVCRVWGPIEEVHLADGPRVQIGRAVAFIVLPYDFIALSHHIAITHCGRFSSLKLDYHGQRVLLIQDYVLESGRDMADRIRQRASEINDQNKVVGDRIESIYDLSRLVDYFT